MSLEQTHTSLELSKFLKEKGFNKKSEYVFFQCEKIIPSLKTIPRKDVIGTIAVFDLKNEDYKVYNRYDFLNDLCVKYGKELLGLNNLDYHFLHCSRILGLMILGKKQEAEKYIIENCIL